MPILLAPADNIGYKNYFHTFENMPMKLAYFSKWSMVESFVDNLRPSAAQFVWKCRL